MKIQTLYKGIEVLITPPVVFIGKIPVLAYRLAPSEVEEITKATYHRASVEPLREIYKKAVDAFKRLQGEFDVLGSSSISAPKVEIKAQNRTFELKEEGLFTSNKKEYRAFNVEDLLSQI